jgi:hypothetical protein
MSDYSTKFPPQTPVRGGDKTLEFPGPPDRKPKNPFPLIRGILPRQFPNIDFFPRTPRKNKNLAPQINGDLREWNGSKNLFPDEENLNAFPRIGFVGGKMAIYEIGSRTDEYLDENHPFHCRAPKKPRFSLSGEDRNQLRLPSIHLPFDDITDI